MSELPDTQAQPRHLHARANDGTIGTVRDPDDHHPTGGVGQTSGHLGDDLSRPISRDGASVGRQPDAGQLRTRCTVAVAAEGARHHGLERVETVGAVRRRCSGRAD